MPLPDDAEMSFYVGETWLWDFDCSEAATTSPTATISAATWRLAKGGGIVKELTIGAGLTASAVRTVSLLLAKAIALTFGPGMYAQELRIDFDDGTRLTAAAGTFVVHASLFDDPVPSLDFSNPKDSQFIPNL